MTGVASGSVPNSELNTFQTYEIDTR